MTTRMSLILFWAEVEGEEEDDDENFFPGVDEDGGGGGVFSFLGADKDGVRRGGIEEDLCLLGGDGKG